MYLPTTLLVSLLAITPTAFSAPVPKGPGINSNVLVTQGAAQQVLHVRSEVYGLGLDAMMEKRDVQEHLVARKNGKTKSKAKNKSKSKSKSKTKSKNKGKVKNQMGKEGISSLSNVSSRFVSKDLACL
jgi:pyocin large subunit-like protein